MHIASRVTAGHTDTRQAALETLANTFTVVALNMAI